jgi:hypothetical protein
MMTTFFLGKFLEIFAWNNLFLAHPFPYYSYFSRFDVSGQLYSSQNEQYEHHTEYL